jgi:excisionase family DNA binding protein
MAPLQARGARRGSEAETWPTEKGDLLAVDQILFSVAEAAGILGIADATLRALVNDGAIQYVQLRYDQGDYRFRRCDLEGFISGLPARRRGEPVSVSNKVTNGQSIPKRRGAAGKLPPITHVRFSATEEANP